MSTAAPSEGNEHTGHDGRYDLARVVDREFVRLRNWLIVGLVVCFIGSTTAGYLVAGQLDRTQWVTLTDSMANQTTLYGTGNLQVRCPVNTRVVSGGFGISNVSSGLNSLEMLRITESERFTQAFPGQSWEGWSVSWWWGGTLDQLRTAGLKISVLASCQG